MPLIACPDCSKPVSTAAIACPACGYPMAQRERNESTAAPVTPVDLRAVLLEVRPSWWMFGWHLLFAWLVIPWLVALYRRNTFVIRIYADRVSVEDGYFSKATSEFFIKDIRAVDVRQGLWGRMVGIGDVTISTAAAVEASEVLRGVPQPHQIKDLLITQRQQSTSVG